MTGGLSLKGDCEDFYLIQLKTLSRGGRSWQAFGERKKCLQFFRRTRLCQFATKKTLFLRVFPNCNQKRQNQRMLGLKIFVPVQTFSAKALHSFAQLLPPCLATQKNSSIEQVLEIEDVFIIFFLKMEDATACRRQRRSCSYWWRDTTPGGSIRR